MSGGVSAGRITPLGTPSPPFAAGSYLGADNNAKAPTGPGQHRVWTDMMEHCSCGRQHQKKHWHKNFYSLLHSPRCRAEAAELVEVIQYTVRPYSDLAEPGRCSKKLKGAPHSSSTSLTHDMILTKYGWSDNLCKQDASAITISEDDLAATLRRNPFKQVSPLPPSLLSPIPTGSSLPGLFRTESDNPIPWDRPAPRGIALGMRP